MMGCETKQDSEYLARLIKKKEMKQWHIKLVPDL